MIPSPAQANGTPNVCRASPPVPAPIRFTRAICGDLAQAERREWWIANGLGGYAGGTIAGSLTRRYHGLLIAPIGSPLGRRLLLAKADATVIAGAQSWPLFTNRWKSGAVAPAGHVRNASFHLDYSVPVWTYEVGDQAIEARIWMEPGAHTTYAAWRLRPSPNSSDAELSLRITLLVNGRDHHATMPAGGFAPEINADRERLRIVEPGAFTLTICAPGAAIVPKHDWYRDFDLPIEAERDLDSVDNSLQASIRNRRPMWRRRWGGGSTMTVPSCRPRSPGRRRRRRLPGSSGLHSRPTRFCLPGRSQAFPTASPSSPAIRGSETGAATP
jgi:Glycogen debranching enzyme N terminal